MLCRSTNCITLLVHRQVNLYDTGMTDLSTELLPPFTIIFSIFFFKEKVKFGSLFPEEGGQKEKSTFIYYI